MYVIRPTGPSVTDLDALVELLGDHHRLRRREAELPRRVLLEGRGDEGRRRVLAPLAPVDRLDHERTRARPPRRWPASRPRWRARSSAPAFSRSVATNSGGAAAARWAWRLQYSWGTKARISRSRSQIRRTATDWTRPGRQTPADLLPEEGADLVADQAVEDAPRLLGVDPLLVDPPGLLERGLDRLLGDLVEEDAVDLVRRELELLGDVPADRLALPVGVGGDVERLGLLARLLQLVQRLRLRPDRDVLRARSSS